jgi:GntR family transcriptional regulator/MocR family aminotransferase
VIVVAGSQQALYLATQVLIDPGDAAWIEDPGYLGARSTLLAAGARLIPVSVDSEGINVSQGLRSEPRPKLIYVSPSNQFPLTITMSLARRVELLECAHRCGAWIIEDDYDSEFRYQSRPVAALKGLGNSSRLIYVGTFSKLLIPTLRLGFVVAPPDMIDAFNALNALISRHPPSLEQVVLADFINEGHLGRHVRRMRSLYLERQEYFREMAEQKLGGLLELNPAGAGTHLIGWLPRGAKDQVVARNAAEAGVEVRPLSSYYVSRPSRAGLVLGYAAFDRSETDAAMRKLASVLRETLQPGDASNVGN